MWSVLCGLEYFYHSSVVSQAAETMVVPLSEPIAGTSCSHLTIPKGTILSIPVNVVQKDPHVWGPDADVFRPDRWLRREKSCIAGRRELFAFSEGYVLVLDVCLNKFTDVQSSQPQGLYRQNVRVC